MQRAVGFFYFSSFMNVFDEGNVSTKKRKQWLLRQLLKRKIIYWLAIPWRCGSGYLDQNR